MSAAKAQLAKDLARTVRDVNEDGTLEDEAIVEIVKVLMAEIDRYVVLALVEQIKVWKTKATREKRRQFGAVIDWMVRDLRDLRDRAIAAQAIAEAKRLEAGGGDEAS